MGDDEIRQFMAALLTRLDAIDDKLTRLWNQTDAAKWEALQATQQPPARELTDAEYDRMRLQQFRDETRY